MEIPTTRTLGLLIRKERLACGWSQQELAGRARVSRKWLTEMEAGKPTSEVGLVLRVLSALGLTLSAAPKVTRAPVRPDDDEGAVDLAGLLQRLREDPR